MIGTMDLEISPDSWHSDGKGTALIDTMVGLQLWSRAREARDAKAAAAKTARDIDKALREIIGDGFSLVTLDGRGLAVLGKTVRRELDKAKLGKVVDLAQFQKETVVTTLELAASVTPGGTKGTPM